MEQQGAFRKTTFGGFDKQEVLSYIEALTKEARDREIILEKQINELSQQNERMSLQLKSFEAHISEMETQAAGQREQIAKLFRENAQYSNIITDKNKKISELESALREKDQMIFELRCKAEDAEALSTDYALRLKRCEEKNRKYDELSNQLAEGFLIAHTQTNILQTDSPEADVPKSGQEPKSIEELTGELNLLRGKIEEIRDNLNQSLATVDDKISSLNVADPEEVIAEKENDSTCDDFSAEDDSDVMASVLSSIMYEEEAAKVTEEDAASEPLPSLDKLGFVVDSTLDLSDVAVSANEPPAEETVAEHTIPEESAMEETLPVSEETIPEIVPEAISEPVSEEIPTTILEELPWVAQEEVLALEPDESFIVKPEVVQVPSLFVPKTKPPVKHVTPVRRRPFRHAGK